MSGLAVSVGMGVTLYQLNSCGDPIPCSDLAKLEVGWVVCRSSYSMVEVGCSPWAGAIRIVHLIKGTSITTLLYGKQSGSKANLSSLLFLTFFVTLGYSIGTRLGNNLIS